MAKRTSKKTKPKNADKPVIEAAEEIIEAEIVEEVVEPQVTEDIVDVEQENEAASVAPEPEPENVSEAQINKSETTSSFFPTLVGGVLAGAIGFGAATWIFNQPDTALQSQISTLEEQISALQNQVSDLPPPTDLSDLESAFGNLSSSYQGLQESSLALADRVGVLERQPSADGTLQDTALAAYESDIQALRDQLAAQQSAMNEMMQEATAQLEATQAEAQAIEEQTIASANAATARSAIARIQGALESGGAYGTILTELESVVDGEIPEALVATQDGAPTLASLISEFPSVARDALAVARTEGEAGEDSTGFAAFLNSQFSVRSVVPKDGKSADAVLSRAENALQNGRLNDALSEIAGLPEVSRGVVSDWVAKAEARAAAVDAATTLFHQYNSN